MSQVILWFWYLILIWFVSFCGTSRLLHAAEETGEQADSERKLSSWIADFFLNSDDTKEEVPPRGVVTVIASRLPSFSIPFADVPANVTYIPANVTTRDRNQIYATQPRDFQGSVRDIEGAVFYDEVGNNVDTTFSLRGFNTSSAVIFLVDGVRVNEVDGDSVTFPFIDMTGIEAIQIDRGSASPIFGSNAFGGVVHITTGKASKKLVSLFGGFEYSSFNGFRFYQGVSGTIKDKITEIGGALTYYFRGARNLNDGFRPNDEYRMTNFDTKVSYELPDEQGRLYFGWKHADTAVSNPGALMFNDFQRDDDQTYHDLDGRKRDQTILQAGADKKFFDNRVVASILASQQYYETRFTTTYATFAVGGEPAPDTDLVTQKSRATDLVWQIGYQDDLSKLHHQSTIGMEMRNADDSILNQDAPGGMVDSAFATNADRFSKLNSAALFWRETLDYNSLLIAHVGMRHDWYWTELDDAFVPTNNLSDRWHKSTLSTGLIVKPVKSTDLFFNYSQGFRVPSISDMISTSAFGTSVAVNLEPVKSNSYEVGSRLRFRDQAQFKTSFFIIDLEDEIVFDQNAITALTPNGQNINASGTRRMGIESRLDVQPAQEAKLYGSYAWTKAYIRETDSAQPFTGVPSLVDERSLGQIPEHRLTFGTVIAPLQRLGENFEGFEVGLHGVFTGKQHPTSFESATEATFAATGGAGYMIKSYTIWDFIASYKWKGQKIYFKINNLFDNKYYSRSVNATSFGGGLAPAGIFNFVNPGAPREYVLGMTWEFGN